MEKTPFWKKTWFIIIALIFIPPLGIALMWISKKQWKSVIKIILSVVLGFWTLILGIAIFSPADETSATESETTTIENSDAEDVTEPATKKPISETKPVTSTTSPTTTETVTESTTEQETTNQPTTTKPATTAKPTTTKKETTTAKPTTTKAPATQNTETNFVLNNNTMKFHYPTCSSVKKIAPENKGTFKGNRQTLLNRGYEPCGICHP
ncbi:MAG: hypothetical protein IKK37_07560 [Clostridia bacterium]|nr:hypothetical protein [Clostridia bacterium]